MPALEVQAGDPIAADSLRAYYQVTWSDWDAYRIDPNDRFIHR